MAFLPERSVVSRKKRNKKRNKDRTERRMMEPGVNFTNILQAAFTRADPKSAKKLLNLTVYFALLGPARVKAARRMLVKWSQTDPRGENEVLK